MIAKADNRQKLDVACRALDRVLRAGRHMIPMWYSSTSRIAHWDVFSRPAQGPKYGTGAPGTFFEIPGSAVPGAFLDSNPDTGLANTSLNSPVVGRYAFEVRGGFVGCQSDAECNDKDDKCTTDACVNGACVYKQTNAPGCCTPEVFVAGFDDGDPKGFTFNNSAGPSKGWQAWGAAASNAKVPPGALYYGDTSKLNYDFGANNGTATSAAINLPASTPSSLSLWLWMDTEGGTSYDNLTIDVVSGGAKTNVFTKNASGFQMLQWFNVKADLAAFQGKAIQLVFTFNTGDSIANSTKGVFVDDIQVITKCGP